VRVTARKDHEVAGAEPFDGAVLDGQLALAARDDVHTAEARLVEADPERGAEFEPPVGGTLETQLAQHRTQDVPSRSSAPGRDERCGLADGHT
jgi:hypothetical protein